VSQFDDIVDFYVGMIKTLKSGELSLHAPLEEIVLRSCEDCFAYIDNRRGAKGSGYDLWKNIKSQFEGENQFIRWIGDKGIRKNLLYSKSEQFPDFMLRARKDADKLICGSLLELKDSKSGSIASFNSTLPTKSKNLDELDIINGKNLVSRIASIMDEVLSIEGDYNTFNRRCFYLIRTYAERDEKVKISIVDGSFFETLPKERLIHQMFLNVLCAHLEQKEIEILPGTLIEIEEALSCITDQTIIAGSQVIEKASIRPRLRIMAEVHTEGNPHSNFYPEIQERSVNFIIAAPLCEKEVVERISRDIPEIAVFTIQHRRNGDHVVFQLDL